MFKLPPYADLIGKPFALGGRGPDSFDCYGLVQELYKRANITIPDYLRPEALAGAHAVVDGARREWEPSPTVPGTVAVVRLLRDFGHVGFILPFDKMIHVWERSGGVTIESLDNWRHRIVCCYRYAK